MKPDNVIACHECDLLQRDHDVPPEGVLRCCRCRATLYRHHSDSLERTLAYALAACALWIISNAFPILGWPVIRFSWYQVMFEPAYVVGVLVGAARLAREHANVARGPTALAA